MVRKAAVIALLAVCVSCSKSNERTQGAAATQAPQASGPETIKSQDGHIFVVNRVSGFKVADLPSNADIKMADNDIARYGLGLCEQNIDAGAKLKKCDVYYQSDKGGSLIGYTVIGQGDTGVAFYTTANLNPAKGSGATACVFGGKLADVKDASHNFDGSLAYSAWEKEPGNWLISTDDAENDPDFAIGVWYVHKNGDKFRITQERWNPCYASANNGYIDDVFYRAASLTKGAS
jgi:hypothetical protein